MLRALQPSVYGKETEKGVAGLRCENGSRRYGVTGKEKWTQRVKHNRLIDTYRYMDTDL
jgi:hypothetical protein